MDFRSQTHDVAADRPLAEGVGDNGSRTPEKLTRRESPGAIG
jgi:hypothetical protein